MLWSEEESGDDHIDNDDTIVIDDGNDVTIIADPPWMKKIFVDGVRVEVTSERVQYIGNDGKLITESLKDYSKKHILKEYKSLDNRIQIWKW